MEIINDYISALVLKHYDEPVVVRLVDGRSQGALGLIRNTSILRGSIDVEFRNRAVLTFRGSDVFVIGGYSGYGWRRLYR